MDEMPAVNVAAKVFLSQMREKCHQHKFYVTNESKMPPANVAAKVLCHKREYNMARVPICCVVRRTLHNCVTVLS